MIVEIDHDVASSSHTSQKRSTSARVVFHPTLTRMVLAAISGATCMASRTRLVFMVPLEQADPCDTEIPAMSKRMTCALALIYGMEIARR